MDFLLNICYNYNYRLEINEAIMKKAMFFENAKLLNDKLHIIPLMYGSLGLEYATQENLNSDDIDIFKNVLEDNGYVLIDEHEHTFIKNRVCFSYAPLEELETFAKINLTDIECKLDFGARFKLLSLEQYLKVYAASSKDGYRVNVRQKKDADKILFIQKHLM